MAMTAGTIETPSPFGDRRLVAAIAMVCIIASAAIVLLPVSDAEDQEYDTDLGQFWSYTVQFQFAGADALSVTYDFGDGSEPVVGDSENPDGWNPRHEFPDKGVYYVTQTVYNTYQGGSTATEVFKLEIMGFPYIEFDTAGGPAVETIQQTAYNVPAERPADPVWEDHIFEGWYTTDSYTRLYDWSTNVILPTTLYAKWTAQYDVVFDVAGGAETIASQKVNEGELAQEPQQPTRSGFIFDGWYDGNTRFSFTTPITEDKTLVAHWISEDPEQVVYTVAFDGNGGVPGSSGISCQEGGSIVLPDAVRDGFTLDGWFAGDEKVGDAGDEYFPTGNVTLTAHWTEADEEIPPSTDDTDGSDGDGFPLWIVLGVLTAILCIVSAASRAASAAVVTVVSAVATVACYVMGVVI